MDDSPEFFGAADGGHAGPAPVQPYRVLARKYRPRNFAQLIGQDAMVRTLANAISRDRLAHAFLMTGVRGVGKTSTARLIAKALNCIGPDGAGGPTIEPCGQCEPCVAIGEGRHIDVIEMDAASHTGVDDVREIIEAVRYAAVSARYKIYIIDEVHMLSRNAFNALLKTLEEPPAHVKFLFATTEVDKLPVTVLSRTQRFDLRRITAPMLKDHFAWICQQEDVEAEDEALAIVAAAAEGSVRDGLSILDQAIAHADMASDGKAAIVTAAQVREMLGLADKSVQGRMLEDLLGGKGAALLDGVEQQYALGVEPVALLRGQMELVHRITLHQLAATATEAGLKGARGEAAAAADGDIVEQFAARLGAAQLHRLWQLLLKGYEEVRTAPDPLVAAQMALLRVMHAADMPDPGTLARQLESLTAGAASIAAGSVDPETSRQGQAVVPATAMSALTVAASPPPSWADLVAQVEDAGMLQAGQIMRDWVRVVALTQGSLVYRPAPGYDEDLRTELRDALSRATAEPWTVVLAEAGVEAQPSLGEAAKAQAQAERDIVRNAPLVQAAMAAFEGAQLMEDAEVAAVHERKWHRA
ncbi:DNA polymerase III subunit gamma/tau [Croceicoccus sp. F390]|uniref:DNA polymerase III subunit gamma/tau n=1 Tax=Croceicoccus esteveae TaxID=3075597 RepID=A0ABU2ZJK0_9SPHN|nr:DNA polymerase III subunit gamma/tau [Croceicoccus sp. F390]MDT0576556.1 DNA polymerase III subunit gamma/tau [Croceicoccus sp. F390]